MRRLRPLYRRCVRGFTLIELAVAMGVSAILAMLVFGVTTFSITFTRRGAADLETAQLARIALSTMVQELREAHAGAHAVAIWPEAADASGDTSLPALAFISARQEVAGRPFAIDGSDSPVWQTAVYYVHDPANGFLRRITRPWDGRFAMPSLADGRVVARGVRSMTIGRQEGLITIALVVHTGRREHTLQTAVHLRN
jgi:prepilin-type N-terminal cleavage/methylation domain-containing protein